MINKVTVNEKHSFQIEQHQDQVSFDGKDQVFDFKAINENSFHIIHENRSYTAEVIHINKEEKTAHVKINGNEYYVSLRDQYDDLLDSMGMNFSAKKNDGNLKAPMPGLVLDIMVAVGDKIEKGANLLILEAMKMENIIKASSDVTIKSIEVTKGAKVEKNQVLIVFE